MKLSIRYRAIYDYETSASFSPHLIRIFPRHDLYVRAERVDFETDATADVQYRQDLFDNLIANCFFPQPLDRLDFRLDLDLVIKEKNPFHFLVDSHALNTPFQYKPSEYRVLTPYLQAQGVVLPQPLRPGSPKPTVETLVTMTRWLHENIGYERRDEGDAFAPEELLRVGTGSCRDFAALYAEVLRQHGIATRLVSGFVWETGVAEHDRKAENALHAWVEACLPGAGWIGMDPTNGIFCNHQFIPTAVGLGPADISPASGHYYGNKTINSTLTTTLEIKEH